MERIVGLAISRYLSYYIKDFTSQKLKNWTLYDLEFKVGVIQEIVGVPPNLLIKTATCNQIYTKIPWTRLGHDPIVLVIDTIYVELEEPHVLQPITSSTPSQQTVVRKDKQSFTDRIIDNIKIEIGQVKLKIQTLGHKSKRSKGRRPATILVQVKDIDIHSTDSKWEVVDLEDAHKVNSKNEVLIYKQINIGSTSLNLQNKNITFPLLADVPLRCRIKNKKEFFGGPTVNFELDFNIPEINLSMNHMEFKSLQDVIDAVMECLYRAPEVVPENNTIPIQAEPIKSEVLPQHVQEKIDEEKEKKVTEEIKSQEKSKSKEKHKIDDKGKQKLSSPTQPQPQPQPQPQSQSQLQPQPQQSMWGRFSSYLSSYYYGSESTITVPEEKPESESESSDSNTEYHSEGEVDVENKDAKDGSDSDTEYYDQASGEWSDEDISIPDSSEGTAFGEEEDILNTTYNISFGKGSVDLYESPQDVILDGNERGQGLINFTFNNFKASFVPSIVRPGDGVLGPRGEPLPRGEAFVSIGDYSVRTLNPPPSKHPHYLNLIEFGGEDSSLEPMLRLGFVKKPKNPSPNHSAMIQERLGSYSKQINIYFTNIIIVFDKEVWERVYRFFFSGNKGRKFEKYMGENLEYMAEAALADYLHFTIESRNPLIILPPFAGHKGKPHIASQILKLHTNSIRMSTIEPKIPKPEVFTTGLFVKRDRDFPSVVQDLSSQVNTSPPITSQKFRVDFTKMWIEMMNTPDAKPFTVLEPVDSLFEFWFHEFVEAPLNAPQLETFASCSALKLFMSQSHYQYFLTVFEERLSFSPRQTKDTKETISTTQIKKDQPKLDIEPFISQVMVSIERCNIELLTVSDGSSLLLINEEKEVKVLAELEFNQIEYVKENQEHKGVIKLAVKDLRIKDPSANQSPFSVVLSSLTKGEVGGDEMSLLLRYENGWNEFVPYNRYIDSTFKGTPIHNFADPLASEFISRPVPIKDDIQSISPPSGHFWAILNRMQISWIYTILAKLQIFITEDEVPGEFVDEKVKKFLSEYRFENVKSTGMNWNLIMLNCEALVVESHSTPECIPMVLDSVELTRVALSERSIIYKFGGQVSFFTFMWDKASKNFARNKLSLPFYLRTDYKMNQDEITDEWGTLVELSADAVDVHVNHSQYIMMLNSLDHQLQVMKDVAEMRAKSQVVEVPKIRPLKDWLKYSIKLMFQRLRVTLHAEDRAFVRLTLINLHYINETWSNNKYIMYAGGDSMSFTDLTTDQSHFTTIVCNRDPSSNSQISNLYNFRFGVFQRRGRSTSTDNLNKKSTKRQHGNSVDGLAPIKSKNIKNRRSFDLRPQQKFSPDVIKTAKEKKLFNVYYETTYSPNPEEQKLQSSHWDVKIGPIQVVYVPDVFTHLQNFFAFMEEHKNLRRTYQTIQTELTGFLKEEQLFDVNSHEMRGRIKKRLKTSRIGSIVDDDDSDSDAAGIGLGLPNKKEEMEDDGITKLSITIFRPVVLFPEKLTSSLTSVVECDMEEIEVTQDKKEGSVPLVMETKVNVKGAQLTLKRIETASSYSELNISTFKSPPSMRIVLSLPVLKPVNLQLHMQRKSISASGNSFLYCSAYVDNIIAIMSISRFQTSLNILQSYLWQTMYSNTTNTETNTPPTSPRNRSSYYKASDPVIDQPITRFMDMVVSFKIKHTNLTVVSDYEASEVELFFLFFKNMDGELQAYREYTEATISCRFEALVNNLNFLTPEKFIDPLHLNFKFRKDNEDDPQYRPRTFKKLKLKSSEEEKEIKSDDSSDSSNGSSDNQVFEEGEKGRVSLDFVVLDKFKFYISKDILRHLLEIYSIASSAHNTSQEFSEVQSHFQYILRNNTEAEIHYWQAGTNKIGHLLKEDKKAFSFSNPYLPKKFEFCLEGWENAEGEYVLDEPAEFQIQLKCKGCHEIKRDLLIVIKPKGLKRYVDFIALHRVRNLCSIPLEFVTIWGKGVWNKSLKPRTYHIPPVPSISLEKNEKKSKSDSSYIVPILICKFDTAQSNNMEKSIDLAVRFDRQGSMFRNFDLHRREFVLRLIINTDSQNGHPSTESVIYLGVTKESNGVTNLTFSPPFILTNLTVFPLNYTIENPHPLQRNASYDNSTGDLMEIRLENDGTVVDLDSSSSEAESEDLTGTAGVVRPNSTKAFYFDIEAQSMIRLILDGYHSVDKALPLQVMRHSVIENKKDRTTVIENEKDTLSLNVFNKGTLLGNKGRIMYVNTQYLFVNATDLLLFVKQRASQSRSGIVCLKPMSRTPFSWNSVGARQVNVKVGDTQWSHALNIAKPAITKLSISMPLENVNLSYDFMMEVKQADAYSRVVIIKAWLHITNLTNRDILLRVTAEPTDSLSSDFNTGQNLLCKRRTRTESAMCPESFVLTIKSESEEEEFNFETLYISEVNNFTLKVDNLANPGEYIAIDVEISFDTSGSYVTLRENSSAPYLLENTTPFPIRLRHSRGPMDIVVDVKSDHSSDSDREVVDLEDDDDMSKGDYDIIYIPPNGSIPYYGDVRKLQKQSIGLNDRTIKAIMYQVSIDVDEDGIGLDDKGKEKEVERPSAVVLSDEEPTIIDDDQPKLNSSGRKITKPRRSNKSIPPVILSSINTSTSSVISPRSSRSKKKYSEKFFTSHFSNNRLKWSEDISLDLIGTQWVSFQPQIRKKSSYNRILSLTSEPSIEHRRSNTNTLLLTINQSGKTKRLTFSLPPSSIANNVVPPPTAALTNLKKPKHVFSVIVRIPKAEIALVNEVDQEQIYASIIGIDVEFSQLFSNKHYVYLVVRDMQVDTMFPYAEHPVLFMVDRKKTRNFNANLFEVLLEWAKDNQTTFIDYLGIRLLPVIIKIDGQVLTVVNNLASLFAHHGIETDETNDINKQQRRIAQYAQLGEMRQDVVDDEVDDEKDMHLVLQKLDVFPLDLTMSIGKNSEFYPVISDAIVSLRLFQRVSTTGTMHSIFSTAMAAYIGEAYSELYKIIGDLDLLTSPLQNGRKFLRGLRDFFMYPLESLVLDDTPGAFIFGVAKGTKSLLLNTTDVLLTVLMKLFTSLSWIIHGLCLDPDYKEIKYRVAQQHPPNIYVGLKQGFFELGRGVWSGISGLITGPFYGVTNEGYKGCLFGLLQGFVGLPLKPIGGIVEFLRIFFESILNSLGRGFHVAKRLHEITDFNLELRKFLSKLPEIERGRIIYQEKVRVMRSDNRIKDRYAIVTYSRFILFNFETLFDLEPKEFQIEDIYQLVLPSHPETSIVLHFKPELKHSPIQLIVPDRTIFKNEMKRGRPDIDIIDEKKRERNINE